MADDFLEPEMPAGQAAAQAVAEIEARINAAQEESAERARRRVAPAPAGNLTAPYDPDRFIPDYGGRMADVPLSNNMSAEPLDISSFGGTPPFVPQQGQSPAGGIFGGIDWKNAKNLAPLAMLLPVIAKSGGRSAVAAFLRGHQQGQARREQGLDREQMRQGQVEEREMRRRGIDLQQARLDADARMGQERRRAAGEAWLREDVSKALLEATSQSDVDRILAEAKRVGRGLYDIDEARIEGLRPGPTKLQERTATRRVDALRKAYGDNWYQEASRYGGITMDTGETITPDELVRRAGLGGVDAKGNPVALPKTAAQVETFAELFPRAAGSAFANKPIPHREDGSPDYSAAALIASRNGWVARDADTSGMARERDVAFIRARIRDAIAGGGKGLAAVRRRFSGRLEALGVDVNDVVAAERELEKHRRLQDAGARSRMMGSDTGAAELSALERDFDAAFGTDEEPAPAPNPDVPPQSAAPTQVSPAPLRPGVTYVFVPGRGLVPKGAQQ